VSLSKTINFYGRFLIPFSRIGFMLKGLSVPERYEGLQGRAVLITGATGGIGAAMALGVARSGGTALAVGRGDDKLAKLVARAEGRTRSRPGPAGWTRWSTMSACSIMAMRPRERGWTRCMRSTSSTPSS
jgi:hypothetical protein